MWTKAFTISLLLVGTQAQLIDLIGGIIDNIAQALNNTEGLLRLELDLSDDTKLALGYAEDTTLNFTELARKYGYEAAEYSVTTEDGFILSLFRLWANECVSRGTPVLLMHGSLQSADAYIAAGPGAGLGYLLADNCHDVWVGSNRGSYYGRRHITLDPDVDAEFWLHSPDEMAQYDLPALIDGVLEETDYPALNYIGFSQGGGTIMMMCSENAAECAKVNVVIGLAPATRLTHSRTVAGGLLFNGYYYLEDTLTALNMYETLSKGGLLQLAMEYSCQNQDLLYELCISFLYLLDAPMSYVSTDTFSVLYSQFPGGVSVRTMVRWAQMIRSTQLNKYDFGSEEGNLAAYNSTTPPAYDLSLVTVPVAVLQGASDHVVDPRDSLWAAGQVSQLLGYHIISDPTWCHFDFMYSRESATYVLPTVLQYLAQYTTNFRG